MTSPLRSLTGALVLLLAACGGPEPLPGAGTPSPMSAATVELMGVPSATYDPSSGKTTVVLQFIARKKAAGADEAVPLSPDEVDVRMRVNGNEVDNESTLQAGSQALSTSLVYGMVLDSSYSMLQHSPPAFEPMKRAAKNSIDKGVELWTGQQGTFTPVVSWFDEYVFTQEGAWTSNDVLSIPAPKEGTATKLFAAVNAMTNRLATLRQQGVGAGARDRHMMLVFSDGADNLSWFDNSTVSEVLSTSSGAMYTKRGSTAVSLEQTLENLRAQPGLTVHVIGLGSKVNVDELKAIASAGRGQYFSNPSTDELDAVFERVTREFATVQTVGATMPIPPGQNSFELVVTPRSGGAAAVCKLTFTSGEGAGIDSACGADSAAAP